MTVDQLFKNANEVGTRRQRERALDEAIATGRFPAVARAAIELVGFEVDSVLWSHTLNVQGHRVDPDPRPGHLTIDGEPQFSAAWL